MSRPQEITLYRPKGLHFWKPKVKYAQGCLLDGKWHGTWTFWYRSGQKQLMGEYARGEKAGTWTKWDTSGVRITEGGFLHGKMHGVWTDWYPNGQKAQESRWYFGKRDGKWTRWSSNGALEEIQTYDHRHEVDKGYSIHTDLEEMEIVREIHKGNLQRNWEMLVGKYVGGLVKPWHIACWVLVFVPTFGLIDAKTAWHGAGLAGILGLFVTSILAWTFDSKRHGE